MAADTRDKHINMPHKYQELRIDAVGTTSDRGMDSRSVLHKQINQLETKQASKH